MPLPQLPEDHNDSPVYQSLVENASIDLAARLAQGDEHGGLLSVYREVEAQSREHPNHATLLITAVIAGETVVANLMDHEELPDIRLRLAGLLVRRSRWDPVARLLDLDRAVAHLDATLEQRQRESVRSSALQMSAAILEERYERTGNFDDISMAHTRLSDASMLVGYRERKAEYHSLRASCACIRLRLKPDSIKSVLEIPLEELSKKPVSWSHVTHKKFRFIDARDLAAGKSLRVVEFDGIPCQRYVALSYVWRGSYTNTVQSVDTKTMTIEGATGADPISIEVLITVCKCVATLGCDLLWIDGVCIVQNDEEDKAWQIQNMFDMYKHCKQCLILPGGLSRLVLLTEPTCWIHRAWTLQEAVAPESCTVLFSWTRGDCVLQTHMPLSITEVEPGKTAKTGLYELLTMSLNERAPRIITPPEWTHNSTEEIVIKILVDKCERSQATALLGAIDYRGQEGLESAIWRASLTRVASRPADAVFSIMGILGVNLDPSQFNQNDRAGATIALMQALLEKGERAEWLGVAPHMEINQDIPTLPKFPTISLEGKALVQTKEGDRPISEGMGDTWWRLVGAPRGSMNDNGALTIYAMTLPIRREPTPTSLEIRPDGYSLYDDKPLGSDVWYTSPSQHGPPYVVKIGRKEHYTNAAKALSIHPRPWLVMLVDGSGMRHTEVKNFGYADVAQEMMDIAEWTEREVVIAGRPY